MAHFIQQIGDSTLAVTITGVFTDADRRVSRDAASALIAKVGKISVLVILQDFKGIGRDVDTGDIEFYAEHADDIVKMAFVGDPKWEMQAHLFTGSGARKTIVKFFPMTEFGQAQSWVTGS